MIHLPGQGAKYLIVVPSLNVAVVTLGSTSGTSLGCQGAYDDAATLSVIWDQLSKAVTATTPTAATATRPTTHARASTRLHTQQRQQQSGQNGAHASMPAKRGGPYMGSCSCVCGDNGFGKCFDVPARKFNAVQSCVCAK